MERCHRGQALDRNLRERGCLCRSGGSLRRCQGHTAWHAGQGRNDAGGAGRLPLRRHPREGRRALPDERGLRIRRRSRSLRHPRQGQRLHRRSRHGRQHHGDREERRRAVHLRVDERHPRPERHRRNPRYPGHARRRRLHRPGRSHRRRIQQGQQANRLLCRRSARAARNQHRRRHPERHRHFRSRGRSRQGHPGQADRHRHDRGLRAQGNDRDLRRDRSHLHRFPRHLRDAGRSRLRRRHLRRSQGLRGTALRRRRHALQRAVEDRDREWHDEQGTRQRLHLRRRGRRSARRYRRLVADQVPGYRRRALLRHQGQQPERRETLHLQGPGVGRWRDVG